MALKIVHEALWPSCKVMRSNISLQNVHANQLVTEKFGYPVHIPTAPNDCGISVGAAWIITPLVYTLVSNAMYFKLYGSLSCHV